MDYFNRSECGRMHCESIPLADLATKFQTPLYVYSKQTLNRHCDVLTTQANRYGGLVCYAVKANSNLSIMKEIFKSGVGADVVSGGEVKKASVAGAKPGKMIFSGVGKTTAEIDLAIQLGIKSINIESPFELDMIRSRAELAKKKIHIALRVNPDIEVKTNPKIATGMHSSKFGIVESDIGSMIEKINQSSYVNMAGIACHIGSQICDLDPFRIATERLVGISKSIKENGIHLDFIDMGGGLGVVYDDESPPALADYVDTVMKPVHDAGLEPVIEIGRAMMANVGGLLTKIIGKKHTPQKTFLVVDGAMTELMRPTLYNAKHVVQSVVADSKADEKVNVVGPVCESGDFLAKDIMLPAQVKAGDLLFVRGCGAYGEAMGSNYNCRPLAASILVDGDGVSTIRRRQTDDEMWSLEV